MFLHLTIVPVEKQ